MLEARHRGCGQPAPNARQRTISSPPKLKSKPAKQVTKAIAASAATASTAAATAEAAASEAASHLPPSAAWASQYTAAGPATLTTREELVRLHQAGILLQSMLDASKRELNATASKLDAAAELHTQLELVQQQNAKERRVLDDAFDICVSWHQRCGAGRAAGTPGMAGAALAADMARQHQILPSVLRFIKDSDPAKTNASLQQQMADLQSKHAATVSRLEGKLSKTVAELQTLKARYDSEIANAAPSSQLSQPDSDYTPHTPAGPSTCDSLRSPWHVHLQPWLN